MTARVLLVEDDPSDVKLFLHAAAAHGVASEDIQVARDGAEAISVLGRASAQLPELVLLDVKMPMVDGLEVLEQLRTSAHLVHLPVVMHSSSRQDRDITRAYELGANAYVVKTVDYRQYSATLGRILDFWLHANTVARRPLPAES